MFELKPLSGAAIPRAIAKAERYRLLNEPQEADSICRDILSTDPDNQEVLAMLLLAITDQFARGADSIVSEAHRVVDRIRGDYERAYHSGIVCERWVKAQLKDGAHIGSASGWFLEALEWCIEPSRQRGRGAALERLRPLPGAQPGTLADGRIRKRRRLLGRGATALRARRPSRCATSCEDQFSFRRRALFAPMEASLDIRRPRPCGGPRSL